jgi:hypothetical protein
MSDTSPRVSVIVPTMASVQRAHLLKRAIDSIRRSSHSPIAIIVVVNGKRFDETTCTWLKAQPDIQFEYVEVPSAPKAVLRGRELITTPFFSTLDDDDEYLHGATDDKLQAMDSMPDSDVVVTNGYEIRRGLDSIFYSDFNEVMQGPLECLMHFNWLHNCNALYRTASIGIDYFRDSHPYTEWTWLAFRLAMTGKRVAALDKPTFRYHDTAESLSKSTEFRNATIPLFHRMLACEPPAHIAREIRRKMGAAWHDAAGFAMNNGSRMEALQCHLKSLLSPGGMRYLSYSRRLFIIRLPVRR